MGVKMYIMISEDDECHGGNEHEKLKCDSIWTQYCPTNEEPLILLLRKSARHEAVYGWYSIFQALFLRNRDF